MSPSRKKLSNGDHRRNPRFLRRPHNRPKKTNRRLTVTFKFGGLEKALGVNTKADAVL